jgi:hypothetical protein
MDGLSGIFRAEYWFSAPTLLYVATAVGAVVVCYFDKTHHRIIGVLILLIVVWAGAAILAFMQDAPERDYVYLIVPPPNAQNVSAEGKVQLWTQATAKITNADTCWLRTDDYPNNHPFSCLVPRYNWAIPEGVRPSQITVALDDWTFDLDEPNKYGQVRQRLNLVKDNHGIVAVLFSQVVRKGTKPLEVLCETPQREGIPSCQ